ncbi:MAG: GNAT family N-acetyltransferase [Clostridia bacterium]|nr:GNAT family N-acetyltransferase [Clostridia bacterium]
MSITLNMFVYDCLEPIKPSIIADGKIQSYLPDDIDELTEMVYLVHNETGVDQKSLTECRRDAEDHIKAGTAFLWKDGQGHCVASCRYVPNGDVASITLVFTRPEYRRRHYAENLVYQVTMRAKDAGYVPILFTDADYVASNACYEKIGYVLRGKLCTIG